MILLIICCHRVLVVLLLWIEMIDITKLEETEIAVLALSIVLYALQTSEEQCLSHHAEVGAERIHYLYRIFCRPSVAVVVVSTTGE